MKKCSSSGKFCIETVQGVFSQARPTDFLSGVKQRVDCCLSTTIDKHYR